jgi:hypothetical protein
MDIGIFAPFGTDHERNISFCLDSDVHYVIHRAGALAEEGGNGVPEPATLKKVVKMYSDADAVRGS